MELNKQEYYPIQAEERYSDYAYRVLRDKIMKLELEPGSPLNEIEIADMLRISRTPVHEAIAKLRDENLVEILPRKESRVTKIDLVRVNDGIFIRSCVEPELITTMQGNVSGPIMQRMLQNINRQKQILQEGNLFNEYNECDDEFHMLLYLAANRENAYQQVRRVVVDFDRVRYLSRTIEDFVGIDRNSFNEHRLIFSAVVYRSPLPMDARELIRTHITRFQTCLDEIIDKYSDYFLTC